MNFLGNIWQWFCLKIIPNIHWNWTRGIFHGGKYWKLTDEDWTRLEWMLKQNYYVILLRRDTHLTTYLIAVADKIKHGEWGYWSHSLMNLEGDVNDREDFRLVEATSPGTHFSPFEKVFDCDSVCLMRPKGFTAEDWNEAMEACLQDIGKPYDTAFDFHQDKKLSCVEMVRNALMGAGTDYYKDFARFEAMIQKIGYLTPQMMYDCPDFEIVLEIRR